MRHKSLQQSLRVYGTGSMRGNRDRASGSGDSPLFLSGGPVVLPEGRKGWWLKGIVYRLFRRATGAFLSEPSTIMSFIGYYNPNPYPVVIPHPDNAASLHVKAGAPVVSPDGTLCPYPNDHLERVGVKGGALARIAPDNPNFRNYDQRAVKMQTVKPLPKGADGFPVTSKPLEAVRENRPVASQTVTPREVNVGREGVTVAKSAAHDGQHDALTENAQAALVTTEGVLSEAQAAIQTSGFFAYEGQEFRSVAALKRFIDSKK